MVLGLWFLVFVLIEAGVLQDDLDYDYDNDDEKEKPTYLAEFEQFGIKMVIIVLCSLKVVRFFLALYLRLYIRTSYTVGCTDNSSCYVCLGDAVSVCLFYDCTICQQKATLDIYQRDRVFFNDQLERI